MKRKFYSSPAIFSRVFLLVFLFCSVTSFGQSYTFNFTGTPPAANTPSANSQDIDGGSGLPIPIEVGVKFRVTQPGTVSAIRFFKGNTDQGSHVGNLWLADGTNLGTVAFVGETGAGGWKEMAFPSPIAVTPGNTYVASYYSDDGYYALTGNYFDAAEEGTAPLIMLCNTSCGPAPFGNGVYDYTAGSSFPNSTFQGSNYWVDVRFTPTFSLPVNLYDLKATVLNKDVAISWKTSTESNNKGFEIQRSNNGSDWYNVAYVDGAGESTSVISYSHADKSLAPGFYYYRVNQVDFDGQSKLSSIVTATISGKGGITLYQNYPNPVKSTSTIRFDLPSAQKVKLTLVDISGREVKVLMNKLAESGTHQIAVSAEGLTRQFYIIRLQTETEILTKKMLVQ